MAPEDSIVKGLKAVADHFGVSLRTAQRWAKEPGFPLLSGRRYDLLQVRAWRELKDGKPAVRGSGQGAPHQPTLPEEVRGKDRQEERLKKAQADLKEMELRRLQGELIEIGLVEKLLAARAMIYRQGLVALERTLPPLLASCHNMREMEAEISRVTREILENVLRALSLGPDQVLKWEKDPPGDPDPELEK